MKPHNRSGLGICLIVIFTLTLAPAAGEELNAAKMMFLAGLFIIGGLFLLLD